MALWDGNASANEKVSMTAGYSDINLSTTSVEVRWYSGKWPNETFQSKKHLVSVHPTFSV